MSLRKSSRLQQSEETPNLRRSGRVRRSLGVTDALDSSESGQQLPRKNHIGRCNNKKQKQKPLAAEQEQQLPQPQLVTSGYEMPPGETRDGIPVLEIPSSPEEEKPKCWRFLLKHEFKPNSREEVLSEDHRHLVNAASILKSQLVARLTSSADNLKTGDMINLASRCYIALRELGDDYTSFSSQVNKLIAQCQELEASAQDMENLNDCDLKARYIQQVQFLSDVTDKLFTAEDKLCRTKTQIDFLIFKKEELTAVLLMLTEELSEEEVRLRTLTAERDQCKEAHSDAEIRLQKLDAEKKEACVAFEAATARYNAAKEEFGRMTNHLLQLLKRSSRSAFVGFYPSNQAAEPSTTSFSTAELATLPSTVSSQPVSVEVSPEDQAFEPAIGVTSAMASPS